MRLFNAALTAAATVFALANVGLLAGADPSRMLAKYMRNTANAAQSYVDGINNPRRDPKQAALKAAGKWGQKTAEAISQGRYAAGVQRADYAAGVAAATSDGGAGYVAGISKRETKIATAFQRVAPLLNNVSNQIQAMPQDTEQQREARLLAARRLMIKVGQQYRGQSS